LVTQTESYFKEGLYISIVHSGLQLWRM